MVDAAWHKAAKREEENRQNPVFFDHGVLLPVWKKSDDPMGGAGS